MSARGSAMAGLCAAGVLLTGCTASSSPAADRSDGPRGMTISTPAPQNAPASSAPSTLPPASPTTVAAPESAKPLAASVTNPGPSDASACATNRAAQLVRVSLRAQHLWMCARTHLAYSTPITSGILGQYTSTPTGTYTIQGLDRNTVLTLIDGRQYTVKYWIPFDGPLFGFHDSSWQDFPYGSAKYRTQGSHGCVHMPLTAIRFLYHWAHVGAKVRIRA
jgi:hypothetical protein